jgi:hypothetical protein
LAVADRHSYVARNLKSADDLGVQIAWNWPMNKIEMADKSFEDVGCLENNSTDVGKSLMLNLVGVLSKLLEPI